MKNLYLLYPVRIFLLLFLYLNNSNVFAATYYVSSSTGDDGRPAAAAQRMATPWKTLSRVGQMVGSLQAGDSVLFKRGDVFFGLLSVTVSGSTGKPVVFGAYGQGALPELTGFVTLSGWQSAGSGIWETTVPGGLPYMNTVTMNGVAKAVGRWPNATAAEQGYLHYDSYNGNTSITDSKLAGQNWNGGQVVIRKTRWILDRNEISSQSGTTINYKPASGYGAAQGYGYFIQNHPGTLNQAGEWYYKAAGSRLGIYTGGSSPDSYQIRAGATETLVQINNQGNLLFDHLRLTGATVSAIAVRSSQNISISNCEILFSGKNAAEATNTDGLRIQNTTIAYTNNNACSLNNCTNAVLSNNIVRCTGIYAGMGDGGDGTYEAITVSGDNNLVANNTIDSTGYIPLNFSGNNVTIRNNVISNFALVKDDGGGIYTWNNGQNAPVNTGRVVTGNIVLNGKGAGGGTDHPENLYAHGIYIDDNAGQVTLTGNTVATCASNGIYIHNAHDIAIKQNTVYNNAVQLLMEHDNIAANSPVYNNTVTGNIFLAKQSGQMAAQYKTKDNDIGNFGTFDNNYYARPTDDDLVIGVLQQVNGAYSYNAVSLDSWKALYGKDGSSGKSPRQIPFYTVSQASGSNQFTNGTFDSNAGGLYAYASAGNAVTGWDSGTLDGGALKVSFSSVTNSSNYASVIIGIGAVTAGKQYRLKFSMLGADSRKAITAYLRQSAGNYSDLSERKASTITAARQEKEYLFAATASEGNASLVFDIPEQPSALYLDNIRVEAVTATAVDPSQYISFLDNPTTSAKTYPTNSPGTDVYGNNYQNSISIQPFGSAIIIGNTASTATTAPANNATCSATGTILREQWDNVGGTSISNIPLQTKPSSISQLTSFEGPLNIADNYGSRVRGYICPPQTGNYIFWLATDDAGELWLSTDDQPAHKARIANIDGWTNYREWGKYSSQKSASITLQAGQKYYVEALQKEGGGGDNLSVQWQLPDATMETPIAGSHLSPYVDTTAAKSTIITGTGAITRDEWDNASGNTIADIPVQNTPTSTSQITSFEGPKDAADNYGSRIRGYIFPPQTGSYTFWIASDDAGELWLSTDDNPANKTRIANTDSWTNYREFGKFSSQKSISITLQAGKKYYIEGLQKEGGGGDNLSVQWQLPDGTMETPIAGIHLSPFTATPAAGQAITFAALASKTNGDAPFALSATASSGLAVSFSVVSGPATLSGSTVTVTGAGTVIIAASQAGNASFNMAKTVSQSFVVMPASVTCSATGTILREEWDNVSGNNISDFSFQTAPTSSSQIASFEGPANIGDNYASRIRGYICVSQTGSYVFWLAADDAGELYLSTDDNPANKVRIANVLSWTDYREWAKFASQKSAAVTLQAGKKYYVEAIQKEGGGGDNLSVQWQLPNGNVESPLPGKYLSPYNAQLKAFGSGSTGSVAPLAITPPGLISETVKTGLFIYPNPAAGQTNIEFALPEAGQTTVVMYNTKGQLISRLFDDVTEANTKKVFALNVSTLQNGVYIIHLISGKTMLTKKLIVVK